MADALIDQEALSALEVAGEGEELTKLAERLDKASTAYGMELSTEKTKVMTKNISGIKKEIKENRQKLETATSFKYMGSIVSDESSKPDSADDSSIGKVKTSLERQEYFSQFQGTTDVLPCRNHLPVCYVNHESSLQSFKQEYKPWK